MITLGAACLVARLPRRRLRRVAALAGRRGDAPVHRLGRAAPSTPSAALLTDLRGDHRGRLRAHRPLAPDRRRPLLDHDAGLLQAGRDVVEPGGLAAALGLGALARPRRRSCSRPATSCASSLPWATAVMMGLGAFFTGLMLVDANPFARLSPAPPTGSASTRCCGTQHDDPPADALLGLRRLLDPVRVRDRGAGHPPPRRELDPRHPPLRADRLAASSGSASCSAPAGPTRSSAGAATGAGTRSRTRR